MYSRPSTSHTRLPLARAMKRGVPPTARKARTGEFTPPGVVCWARSNSAWFRSVVMCGSGYGFEQRGELGRTGMRVGGVEDVADHGEQIGARSDQWCGIFRGDAADTDDRTAECAGLPDQFERGADRLRFRRRREHRAEGDVVGAGRDSGFGADVLVVARGAEHG